MKCKTAIEVALTLCLLSTGGISRFTVAALAENQSLERSVDSPYAIVIETTEGPINRPRGGEVALNLDPSIVQSQQPTFQLPEVEGATEYHVKIQGYELNCASFSPTAHWHYPATCPQLQPNEIYELSLTVNGYANNASDVSDSSEIVPLMQGKLQFIYEHPSYEHLNPEHLEARN